MLCQIVEKISGKKVKGIDWHPSKITTAIKNTKIVLDELVKLNTIPQYYKKKVTEIVEGNDVVIMELLKRIKKSVESKESRKNSIEIILDQRLKHGALNKSYFN